LPMRTTLSARSGPACGSLTTSPTTVATSSARGGFPAFRSVSGSAPDSWSSARSARVVGWSMRLSVTRSIPLRVCRQRLDLAPSWWARTRSGSPLTTSCGPTPSSCRSRARPSSTRPTRSSGFRRRRHVGTGSKEPRRRWSGASANCPPAGPRWRLPSPAVAAWSSSPASRASARPDSSQSCVPVSRRDHRLTAVPGGSRDGACRTASRCRTGPCETCCARGWGSSPTSLSCGCGWRYAARSTGCSSRARRTSIHTSAHCSVSPWSPTSRPAWRSCRPRRCSTGRSRSSARWRRA
jgi:hypothetical protein